MNSEERERKLKKIKRIMNACCEESLSVARYTIEDCITERGVHVLLFAYNAKNEVIEARLADVNDMVEIAEKIRRKAKAQVDQSIAIARIVAEKYDMCCCVEVAKHHRDLLRIELYFKDRTIILEDVYNNIIDKLLNETIYESK